MMLLTAVLYIYIYIAIARPLHNIYIYRVGGVQSVYLDGRIKFLTSQSTPIGVAVEGFLFETTCPATRKSVDC